MLIILTTDHYKFKFNILLVELCLITYYGGFFRENEEIEEA